MVKAVLRHCYEGVTSLAWLGKSRFIAKGTADGIIPIWDSLSGDCVRTFHGHNNAIQGLSVSATEFLVSASLDGAARVFEIAEYR
ncbi:hypothetical protein Syun_003954 [Stephania yunnanensis]|uniref:Anaphase-promoting complex subunit 4-like WD40 domain-containing protein n=1 Tax=Stephania yunnanensis TaxID=152371 RepID=A0AAP0L3M8_9MAGN